MIPSAAIIVARTMKATKENESSALSLVWNSTVSHTTASAGEPDGGFLRRRAASETRAETGSIAIAPSLIDPELGQPGDDDAGILACEVAEEEVAARTLGDVAEADEVQRRRMV